jgi:hypothetical protein
MGCAWWSIERGALQFVAMSESWHLNTVFVDVTIPSCCSPVLMNAIKLSHFIGYSNVSSTALMKSSSKVDRISIVISF